MIKKTTFAR